MLNQVTNAGYQIVIGYFAADFITGFIHWIEDKYTKFCTEYTFLSTISKNNELHHTNPEAILIGTFYDNIKNALIASIFLFLLMCVTMGDIMKRNFVGYSTFFILATCANNIHRYAHETRANIPKAILFLQNAGILSSGAEHKIHHEKGESRYCLIGDYTNKIVDYIHLWSTLEIIVAFFGIKANTAKPIMMPGHPYRGRKLTNMYIKNKEDYTRGLKILKNVYDCNS